MKTKLKASQRLRVLIDGISVWTTARQVRNGLGDRMSVNFAVQDALNVLEADRAAVLKPKHPVFKGRTAPTGIVWRSSQRGELRVYDVQLDMI